MTQPSHFPDPKPAGPLATLGSGLDSLACAAPPVSRIDIDRAVADGRAGRRRRAAGILSSSAATLAVVGVVAAAIIGHTGASNTTAASGHTAGLPPAATVSGPAGTTSTPILVDDADPVVIGARFGWLPGSSSATPWTLQVRDGIAWLDSSSSGGGTPSSFRLGTFAGPQTAQGALKVFQTGWPYRLSGQTTIGSQPAYWLDEVPSDGGGSLIDLALVWLPPNGHWSVLTAVGNGVPPATLEQQMLHVARTVTPASTEVALPLRVSHVPVDAGLDNLNLEPSGSDWMVEFSLWTPSYTLVYQVGPAGSGMLQPLGPSRCKTADGSQGCVTMEAGAFSKSAAADGVLDTALADVTLTGADPSTWTTDVFSH